MRSDRVSPPRGTYSQAIRVAAGSDLIFLSGLTSRARDGSVIGAGDPALQVRTIFAALRDILEEVGGGLADVVKVTIFVTSMADSAAVQAERSSVFPIDPPASTMVEVSALADPDLCVEIEFVAAIAPQTG